MLQGRKVTDARPIGVSLKSEHYSYVLANRPAVSFFEVHAENYMMEAGPHHRFLQAISEHYPLSIHGVGMSLGSAEGLDSRHVALFKELVELYKPALVSEHLAWSVQGGHYLNDLLPLPYNAESLEQVCANIDTLQSALGRQILVENPSSYMSFVDSSMSEAAFLHKMVQQTGCALLMDVNNIFVSCRNMNWSIEVYLDEFPMESVQEFHLAGHLLKDIDGSELRIDDHGSEVSSDVWDLYARILNKTGARPTLVEWDTNIPDFETLFLEAEKASFYMREQDGGAEEDLNRISMGGRISTGGQGQESGRDDRHV